MEAQKLLHIVMQFSTRHKTTKQNPQPIRAKQVWSFVLKLHSQFHGPIAYSEVFRGPTGYSEIRSPTPIAQVDDGLGDGLVLSLVSRP